MAPTGRLLVPDKARSAILPLLISSGPRALPTAVVASAYYAAAGIESIIVRPRACAAEDRKFATGTRFIDDESLPGVEDVRRFLQRNEDTLAGFNRTPGWFLQQFIKLAAVAVLDTDLVFVADGDTVFSATLLQSVLQDPRVLTTGEKFENYDRLVVALGLTPPGKSCVANGNVFSSAPVLRELATPAGFERVLRDHVFASHGRLDFSEYQIAGSLLEPRLGARRIRMFRRFDMLISDPARIPGDFVTRALQRYDAVAIEVAHHRSVPKRLAAHLLYRIGRSW